jgi:hypothetical protein
VVHPARNVGGRLRRPTFRSQILGGSLDPPVEMPAFFAIRRSLSFLDKMPEAPYRPLSGSRKRGYSMLFFLKFWGNFAQITGV